MAGWTITVTDDRGASIELNTDRRGRYSVTGLRPGSYTVCEGTRDGFVQVFPRAGATCPGGTFGYQIGLGSGQVVKHRDFGNQPGGPPPPPPGAGRIEGMVVLANDPTVGLGGWPIFLFDANGTTQLSQTMSEDLTGHYEFTNLQAGTYLVCEDLFLGANVEDFPASGAGSAPCTNGTVGYLITITAAGEVITGKDFRNLLAG